jgi:hypothetical protein
MEDAPRVFRYDFVCAALSRGDLQEYGQRLAAGLELRLTAFTVPNPLKQCPLDKIPAVLDILIDHTRGDSTRECALDLLCMECVSRGESLWRSSTLVALCEQRFGIDRLLSMRSAINKTWLHILADISLQLEPDYSSLLHGLVDRLLPSLVRTKDNDGNTPLHLCSSASVATKLLRSLAYPGEQVGLCNKAGRTPLDEAEARASFSERHRLEFAVLRDLLVA